MKRVDVLWLAITAIGLLSACSNKDNPAGMAPIGSAGTDATAGVGAGAPAAGQSGGQATGTAGAAGAATGASGSSAAGTGSAAGSGSMAGQGATAGTGTPAAGSGGAPAAAGSGGAPEPAAGNGGTAGMSGSGDPEFDACLAQVKPDCVASEMSTAELMETPCSSLKMIPIPLTGGGTYGPVTLPTGPYAGKVEWNEGAGTPFVNEENILEPVCVPAGIETFMEPAVVNAEIINLRGLDHKLYTIFRPACFKAGEKYPVITWANGTCGEMAGYSALLSSIASHGFVIVAANSTWTNTPPTNGVQLRALDYAKALNEDQNSIFYQRLDLDKVGAMGHSQGAAATAAADDDPRIKAVIFWNSGTSNVKPFLNVSGERDVRPTTPEAMQAEVDAATQPGAFVFHKKVLQTGGTSTGHLVLMMQPERVIDLAVAWWKWQLNGDQEAKKMFVGTDCGFCKMPDDFAYGHNSLLQ